MDFLFLSSLGSYVHALFSCSRGWKKDVSVTMNGMKRIRKLIDRVEKGASSAAFWSKISVPLALNILRRGESLLLHWSNISVLHPLDLYLVDHRFSFCALISLGIEIREGFMGKKKEREIKELAVAIGESPSVGDESSQNQSQPQNLRKRGRPRKVVEKTEGEDEKKDGVEQLADSVDVAEESLKKQPLEINKSSSEEERRDEFPQVDSSSAQEKQLPKGEPSRSRKARRKSKPRKSS